MKQSNTEIQKEINTFKAQVTKLNEEQEALKEKIETIQDQLSKGDPDLKPSEDVNADWRKSASTSLNKAKQSIIFNKKELATTIEKLAVSKVKLKAQKKQSRELANFQKHKNDKENKNEEYFKLLIRFKKLVKKEFSSEVYQDLLSRAQEKPSDK